MPIKSRPRLLRYSDLAGYGVPFGRTAIWTMMKRGEFPLPIRCGLKKIAFDSRAVDKWIADRIANSPPAGPGTRPRTRADREAA